MLGRISVLLSIVLITFSTSAHAVTYTLNRAIGAGSVVGVIKTDGTFGALTSGNIVDFRLTLRSPNLSGGSPQTFSKSNGGIALGDTFLVASSTSITYDFTNGNYAFFYSLSTNDGWCIHVNYCGGASSAAETIFWTAGFGPAETLAHSGVKVIANAYYPVPLPAAGMLLIVALGGLGVAARRSASF